MEPEKLTFSPLIHHQIEAGFSGDQVTSDTGLLLLREVDKQHPLTHSLTSVLQDPRPPRLVRHKLDTIVRQRVFGEAGVHQKIRTR
ncbi:Transposase DDE domain group 1 [Marinobacter segnicrescens]|uniref:Transposase DDE domain group 1 n=1 Tax=Marinobacter segnicrescens TaxID=430453 RepID=A0A1I0IA47_9GAMM|nr:Transposase DDE domain group 1 [Marinobacter segnicrescens]